MDDRESARSTRRRMPELPDVEIFKRYLDSTALHQPIRRTEVREEDLLRGVTPQKLARRLKGARLEAARRHGKFLLVRLDTGSWLVLHFGMTGFLRYFRDGGSDREPGHVRLLLHLENGWRLAYDCQRKLGEVGLADDADRFVQERGLGPDALEMGREEFLEALEGRRGMVKPTLMNQRILAGVGNVYSDEALFQARIDPRTSVAELDAAARRRLRDALRETLETAIAARVDPERFPDGYLLPRREEGASCPRGCGGRVERIVVSGRGAYRCPGCQGAG